MATATIPASNVLCSGSDAAEARLQAIAEMFVYGASHQEILARVQKQWGVSRRTAQDDLHTVRQRLAGEAATEDQLVALRLAQLQRDKLVGLALRYTLCPTEDFDPKVLQALAGLITAVRGLLDSRDRTTAELQQLVDERVQQAAKVVPERELPSSGVLANGHVPVTVAPVNGQGRIDSDRNGGDPSRVARKPGTGTTVPRVILRPPLPPDQTAAAVASAASVPNRRANQEIEPARREPVAEEAVCAGCAGA